MADAAVVGAGMGGLSAAITLAVRGFRTTVFEADARPGGKAGTATVDGVTFDTGPSLLTLPDVFDDLARLAGTRLVDEVTLVRPDPSFRYRWPDGTGFDARLEVEHTLAAVGEAFGPQAERELAGFLGYAARIWSAARPRFVLGPAPTFTSLLSADALRDVAAIDPAHTMATAIRDRVKDPHLRGLLLRFATYVGSDPRRAPAALNCIAHVELGLGGYGVQGGIAALIAALVRIATRVGVTFRLGEPVRRIEIRAGVAIGVSTDKGLHPAEVVVANAEPAHTFGELCALPLPTGPLSTSGYTCVIKARRRPRAGHTVWFTADPDAELGDLFDRSRPPADPTVYLCAQEVAHGRTGWPDHEPVFVMTGAPAEPLGGTDPSVWVALEAAILARLRAHGLCDSDDAVVWRRTPTDLAARFPGSRGALYGAASHGLLAAFRRLPNRVAGVAGLYLASGGAHPGGGLPLCAASGRAAAEAACSDLRGGT